MWGASECMATVGDAAVWCWWPFSSGVVPSASGRAQGVGLSS